MGHLKIIGLMNLFVWDKKSYSFKCNNENKNKLKGITKSLVKSIKFEEYKNCLFGDDYQRECENYVIRSLNHDMYLQR